MPNLIAYDICGVQPMSGPTVLIFAMRSRINAQDGNEALLFEEADTDFSARNKAGSSVSGNSHQLQHKRVLTQLYLTTLSVHQQVTQLVTGMSTAYAEALKATQVVTHLLRWHSQLRNQR